MEAEDQQTESCKERGRWRTVLDFVCRSRLFGERIAKEKERKAADFGRSAPSARFERTAARLFVRISDVPDEEQRRTNERADSSEFGRVNGGFGLEALSNDGKQHETSAADAILISVPFLVSSTLPVLPVENMCRRSFGQ